MKIIYIILLITLIIMLTTLLPAVPTNLILNPSFETDSNQDGLANNRFDVMPNQKYQVKLWTKAYNITIFRIKLRWLDATQKTIYYDQLISPFEYPRQADSWDWAQWHHCLPTHERNGTWGREQWIHVITAPPDAQSVQLGFWAEINFKKGEPFTLPYTPSSFSDLQCFAFQTSTAGSLLAFWEYPTWLHNRIFVPITIISVPASPPPHTFIPLPAHNIN